MADLGGVRERIVVGNWKRRVAKSIFSVCRGGVKRGRRSAMSTTNREMYFVCGLGTKMTFGPIQSLDRINAPPLQGGYYFPRWNT